MPRSKSCLMRRSIGATEEGWFRNTSLFPGGMIVLLMAFSRKTIMIIRTAPDQRARDFFDAIENRDIARLRRLIAFGTPIDIKNADGKTGLQVALYDNDVDTTLFLLQSGANVKVAGHDGGNLLHDAAWHADLTKLLLQKSLDPNEFNQKGLQPIHVAARAGSIGSIKYLTAAGADICGYSKERWAPIHYAAENLDPSLHDAMVELGADQHARISFGGNMMHVLGQIPYYGMFAGDPDTFIRYLQTQGFGVNDKDDFDRVGLHYAAARDDSLISGSFIRNRASVLFLDSSHKTPVDLANSCTREQLRMAARNEAARSLVSQLSYSPRPT